MSIQSEILRINEEVSAQAYLIQQIRQEINSKTAGDVQTEEWIFTMEDGTTVTKEVVVA